MASKRDGRKPPKRGDYEVGYGRPPKEHQFTPGSSPNPNGRPKKAKGVRATVRKMLLSPVTLRGPDGARTVTTLEAGMMRLREKGLNGELRSLEKMLALAIQYLPEETEALWNDNAEIRRTIIDTFLKRHASTGEPVEKDGEQDDDADNR